MSKRTVWTDYLTEEAVYRFWYTLENNNFKNSIKKAQKNAKMNYANMHNALYSGLYFPDSPFVYGYRTVQDIRVLKNLGDREALANNMTRDEMLKNIHAMFQCANYVKTYAPYGYNAKMFAKQFFSIGLEANKEAEKMEHRNPTLKKKQSETTEEVPNRYRLSKSLQKLAKSEHIIYKQYRSEDMPALYEEALKKYQLKKAEFAMAIAKFDDSSKKTLSNSLDSGFYNTVLPFYGFDIANIITDANDNNLVVTRHELLGHAKKFDLATKAINENSEKSFPELCEIARESGQRARDMMENFCHVPECQKGFINEFCDMLAKIDQFDPSILIRLQDTDIPEIMKNMITVVQNLLNSYTKTEDPIEKQEIKEQVEKIKNALEKSNENNI